MKRKKLRVSLLDFLATGRFGPFVPCRDISPEELIEILGVSDPIEWALRGRPSIPQTPERASHRRTPLFK